MGLIEAITIRLETRILDIAYALRQHGMQKSTRLQTLTKELHTVALENVSLQRTLLESEDERRTGLALVMDAEKRAKEESEKHDKVMQRVDKYVHALHATLAARDHSLLKLKDELSSIQGMHQTNEAREARVAQTEAELKEREARAAQTEAELKECAARTGKTEVELKEREARIARAEAKTEAELTAHPSPLPRKMSWAKERNSLCREICELSRIVQQEEEARRCNDTALRMEIRGLKQRLRGQTRLGVVTQRHRLRCMQNAFGTWKLDYVEFARDLTLTVDAVLERAWYACHAMLGLEAEPWEGGMATWPSAESDVHTAVRHQKLLHAVNQGSAFRETQCEKPLI